MASDKGCPALCGDCPHYCALNDWRGLCARIRRWVYGACTRCQAQEERG